MKLFSEYRGLRKELYILFIGRIMTNMGSMIWPMFTLILSTKLGLNAGEIAKYFLVYGIACLPVSLIGGKLADKYNKKNLIVICDLISVVSYIYCSLIEIDIKAVVAFSLAGIFQSVEWPSYDALVADFTLPKDRDRAYSLSYLGANLGLVLAPTLGGILLNNHLNLAFFINGCSILLSTILIFFFIKNISREESIEDVNVYEKELGNDVSTLTFLSKSRVLLLYILSCTLCTIVYNQYNYLMPLDLTNQFGENGSVIFGSVSSLNCIVVVLFTSIITKLFNKTRDTSKFLLGQFLEVVGLILFRIFLPYVWMSYVAMYVFTIGEIFNTLGSSPFSSKRIPANHRGRITSINNVVCSLVSSLLNLYIGKVYDISSINAWKFIYVMGALAVLTNLTIKILDKKDYRELYQ